MVVVFDQDSEYGASAGSDTQDQILLLSITKVAKYFSSESVRQCKATAYVEAQGAYVSSSKGLCSCGGSGESGYISYNVSDVDDDRSVGHKGTYVNRINYCARSVLWINVES